MGPWGCRSDETGSWVELFDRLEANILEVQYLDCPWWPDIVNPAKMLQDFFPFLKSFPGWVKSENRGRWDYTELPYYRPLVYPEIHQQMSRLAYFENSRLIWLKRLFAHHVCILASKG
jgi:hypothetical protein